MEPLAEDLTSRGIAVWNIDYRRVGDGGGGTDWRVTLDDVSASLDQLGRCRRTTRWTPTARR